MTLKEATSEYGSLKTGPYGMPGDQLAHHNFCDAITGLFVN